MDSLMFVCNFCVDLGFELVVMVFLIYCLLDGKLLMVDEVLNEFVSSMSLYSRSSRATVFLSREKNLV